ncbi:uncharacterized protein [Rutidosis leptorrhynchoides]|uniref:uncharacterized protein n=1 Tax=Rutidosis leptorrhynchoides TaxID=125765 RepID=UPI003A990900
MEERDGPRSELWCDFHEAWGHDTDNCKSLMREIIAKIKAGELNHLLPGKQYRRNDPKKKFAWQKSDGRRGSWVENRRREEHGGRENRNPYGEREPTPEVVIKMVWFNDSCYEDCEQSENNVEGWRYAPIIFQPIQNWTLSVQPVVISAVIANKFISRIYTDTGSEADIIYWHCLRTFPRHVQDRARRKNLKVSGLTGIPVNAMGRIRLEVVMGTFPLLRTETIDFIILEGTSRFNVLFERTALAKFGAIASTAHAEIRFPTPNGVAAIHSQYVAPTRERSTFANFPEGRANRRKHNRLFRDDEVQEFFIP